MRRLLAMTALLLLPVVASGQGMIFRWVDAQGNLHVTDRLGDVPEPYYGMYLAELKRREEQRQAAGQPAGQPAAVAAPTPAPSGDGAPAAPRAGAEGRSRPAGADGPSPGTSAARSPSEGAQTSLVDAELDRRETWRKLVAAQRQELAEATAALAALEAERAAAAQNPLLVHTPAVAARLAELDAQRAALLARLEKARAALLVDLPARARKENVPPKWLQ